MSKNNSILFDNASSGRADIGIIKESHSYKLITPYGFDITKCENNKHLQKIFVRCIAKALRSNYVRRSLKEEEKAIGTPVAALYILIDYIQNGTYKEVEHDYKVENRGKINFKKTIKNLKPYIVDDEPVYSNFVVSHTKINDQDLVAVAQGNVINHFISNGGEIMFGCNISINVKKIKFDQALINTLLRIKAESFNSRKQQLIQWIVDYIKGEIFSEKKDKCDFTIVASTLWEEMIFHVYGNQIIHNNQMKKEKSKYGLSYKYYTNPKLIYDSNLREKTECSQQSTSSQHDAVYETENNIIIIDAKMYRNVIRTSSYEEYESVYDEDLKTDEHCGLVTNSILYKQFGYFLAARLKNPTKRIFNVLIKPNTSLESPGFRGFIPGYGLMTGEDLDDFILIYEADFIEVMKSYDNGTNLGFSFMKEIEKYLSSVNNDSLITDNKEIL